MSVQIDDKNPNQLILNKPIERAMQKAKGCRDKIILEEEAELLKRQNKRVAEEAEYRRLAEKQNIFNGQRTLLQLVGTQVYKLFTTTLSRHYRCYCSDGIYWPIDFLELDDEETTALVEHIFKESKKSKKWFVPKLLFPLCIFPWGLPAFISVNSGKLNFEKHSSYLRFKCGIARTAEFLEKEGIDTNKFILDSIKKAKESMNICFE